MNKLQLVLCALLAFAIVLGIKQFYSTAKGKLSDAVDVKKDHFLKARRACTSSMKDQYFRNPQGFSKEVLYQDCMMRKGYFVPD
tara:strand:- start:87 stop:338 length:252 start_codon:yes stop_codon:yes gene_type:complete